MSLKGSVDIPFTNSTKVANDAWAKAEESEGIANDALVKAEEAINSIGSANGANTNYFGIDEPEKPKEGDLWFRPLTDGTSRPLRYSGTAWIDIKDSIAQDAKDILDSWTTDGITINGVLIKPDTVGEEQIIAGSITTNKIAAGAIGATEIAAKSIVSDNLATNAITTDKIAAGAIDASKLSVNSLSAISSDLGSVKAGDILISDDAKTTFMRMLKGQIFITDKDPNMTGARVNANDMYINKGAIFMYGNNSVGVSIYELDLAPKYILLTELTASNVLKHQTSIRAEYIDTPKVTTKELIVNGPANLNSNVNIEGLLTVSAIGSDIYMNNFDILNVNRLTFNDPGNNEGIEWVGGNGWKIQESPDAGTNAAGNLQFFTGTTRRATIGTTGNMFITGSRYVIQGSGGSFEAEGKLSILNTVAGAELHLHTDATGAFVQSATVYNRTYSGAANMYITSAGVLGRSTSASKYKLEIEDSNADHNKLLNLIPKTWYDKSATEAYSDALTAELSGEEVDWDELDIPDLRRVPGLRAEDVVEAGMDEYVIYGTPKEDGTREVEGLMYDRLWTPLIPIVREQAEKIASLEERISRLEALLTN